MTVLTLDITKDIEPHTLSVANVATDFTSRNTTEQKVHRLNAYLAVRSGKDVASVATMVDGAPTACHLTSIRGLHKNLVYPAATSWQDVSGAMDERMSASYTIQTYELMNLFTIN